MGGWRVRRVSLHPLFVLPALSSCAISAFCANESPARNESSSANVLSSGYADSCFSRVLFLFSFFFFPTTIVPRLTRQRPCLPFPSILFAWRMYPIIYKNFVDVIFSMKIKKCVLRSEKKNFDRFRIIVHYRLRIYTIFNYRCVYTYKNTLYIITYIRIPPNIFIERGRVSILFWFPPPFERAVPTRHSELGVV